jgi:Ala-tRNA(Pro) deacylase
MAKTSDLQRYLNNNGIPYKIIEHNPAFSAHGISVAAHVPENEIAKTVILHADGKFWMAVLRGDNKINLHMIKQALGARQVHLAHEEDLNSLFPDCQLGTMPPFGNLYGIPVLVDQALTNDPEISFNACCYTKVIRMKFDDFRTLVNPLVGHYAEPHFTREEAW